MSPVFKSFLTVVSLASALIVAVPAQQGLVSEYTELIDLGVYDMKTRAFVGAVNEEGTAPVGNLVYDNTTFDPKVPSSFLPGILGQIHMDQGVLGETNGQFVVAVGLNYGSGTVGEVDIDIRLHRSTSEIADPGSGIVIPLRGFPGAIDPKQPLGYTVIVLLDQPYLLPPGPIRFAYQAFDNFTGPVLVEANPPEWGSRNRFDVFTLDAQYLFNWKQPNNVPYDNTVYFQLYTDVIAFDPPTGAVGTLGRRDRFEGSVESGALDDLRYDGVEGERLKLSVAASKGSELTPRVEVIEVASGQTIGFANATTKKVKLTIDELPAAGGYIVRVSGLIDSAGDYKLRFAARLPKSALKPPPAGEPSQPGSTLVSFVGKPGDLLNATVRPVAKSSAIIDRPLLEGPLGPIDLTPFMQLKNGGRWVIKKLPLSTFGAYELRAGPLVGPGTSGKARIKSAKPTRNRVTDTELEVAGTWIKDEFVTSSAKSLMTFDLRGNKGNSGTIRFQDQYVITRTWKSWKVTPNIAAPGSRLITTQLALPIVIQGSPSIAPPQESTDPSTDQFRFQAGDPNVIEYNSGVVWRRDFSAGPDAPVVVGTTTASLGTTLPDGQAALRIECVDEAAFFDIYRADIGAGVPDFPVERHSAVCDGDDTIWVDQASVGPQGFVPGTYWVRAVDEAGNKGPLSEPVDILAP